MGSCLYDVWTVFWRDWVVLRRRMVKFILSRMVAPMLYLVAFGWGLGRSIQVDSGSYLDFLIPGILALNSMNISFNSITPVHAERVYHKSLEEYIIAPIWPYAFLIGKVLSAILRGLISSALFVLLAFCFGAHVALTPLFLLVLALNCVIFAELGFYASMKVNTYEEMGQVNTYILVPMSFLCGTFFATSALPEALRVVIECLPLTHTSYLLRGLGSGMEVAMSSVFVLGLYALFLFLLGSKAFLDLRKH